MEYSQFNPKQMTTHQIPSFSVILFLIRMVSLYTKMSRRKTACLHCIVILQLSLLIRLDRSHFFVFVLVDADCIIIVSSFVSFSLFSRSFFYGDAGDLWRC